jgi:hypothetical protein
VESIPYSTEQELQQLLGKTINRLLNVERLRATDLIVLTPRGMDDTALSRLKLSGQVMLVEKEPNDKLRHIQYSSIDQFKGLERGAAIVVELDESMMADSVRRDALCYVAFSRPRHHLVLMGASKTLQEVVGGSSRR